MELQPLFRQFHESILLKRFGENAELREKRDRILDRLRANLPRTFEPFNQGSYAMGTGIKPLDGDYDIDIGIAFDLDHRQYTPVEVKQWVYDAVRSHTTRVEWRHPCITVYYQQSHEAIYHVDLAVFARGAYGRTLHLAMGKQHASTSQQDWQPDDRQGFVDGIEQKYTGEDAAQFRRVIRYLKRWKDVHFSTEGRAAPTGLSLTVAAYYWFQPTRKGWYSSSEYNDLAALVSLVNGMRQNFTWTSDPKLGHVPRLSLKFPNAPHDDVFKRMTNQQMLEFHLRLEKLGDWLAQAQATQDTPALQRAFGNGFPAR